MMALFTRHLYLLAVGGSALAFTAAQVFGWPAHAAILAWSILTLAAGALLERLAPFDLKWNQADADTAVDATSAVVLIGVVDPLAKAVLPLLAAALFAATAEPSWLLSGTPLAMQILAVVLWVEFAKYWSHRLHHEHSLLWGLHALHHSSERLYWLNNFRFHPLNHLTNTVVSLLPLALLGAPQEVVLGALAVTQPVLMLQHLNARTDNGWLNHVFSTNEVHRWHHSDDPAQANANYGSALVLWDHVFGTFRQADGKSRPARIGLFGDGGGYTARASYLRQMLSPLMPACCRA
ncbi:sterol desaturase family protein [Pseudomonas aeruginosa]|nr:sterol desaturase family protein [Pseudomonas aeruginosa]EKU5146025.1 sterol desaturase family protein [Pseudomonas aeruginosa]EKW4391030.1 sterol desaturase family protein [Pseudomonas aeruginosa]EKX8365144.1 sterol desaturase family protein [Pseudomonas aeruginosa]EKY1850167.1 sterol desaturase family protein [Pseudomonas aeruginosa]